MNGWPIYSKQEIDAVNRVLQSGKVNYWTGNEVKNFEIEFADWCSTNYAVAVMNGTVALELALRSLNISNGDEVVVTSRTFIASVSSIITLGAIPVFADISPDSQNISPESIKEKITPKTKAIICVHLAGWPCEMDYISKIANENGLYIIEDCAQAHGAKYKGKSVGSIGHIGCWSFCQDKIISTGGEGGMVTTNDKELWSLMWSYKDHGKSYDKANLSADDYSFKWLHHSFGSNLRMTEMQAAIGRIQLSMLSSWTKKRQKNAEKIYFTARKFRALYVPEIPDYIEHAFYKCYIFVNSDYLLKGWGRDRIIEELNSLNTPCFPGICSEVYKELAFINSGNIPEKPLPIAKKLGDTSLMFLVHPNLSESELKNTCNAIENVMQKASS